MSRKYSNTSKVMALAVAVNTVVTTLTVDDASGLPVTFPYSVAVDFEASNVEICLVTSAAGNVLTVTRAQEDTPAASHSAGAVVVHCATALDFQQMVAHVDQSTNVHGVGALSAVVGTQTSQTLINKVISGASNTLSSIAGSALTGAITVATIAVANVTGDWPIDTRSTGSLPVDTRTTGNLPGSRVASPITAAMTFSAAVVLSSTLAVTSTAAFSNNVTVAQASSGSGLTVTNHASAAASTAVIVGHQTQPALTERRNNSTTTGVLHQGQGESPGFTDLYHFNRDGSAFFSGAVEASDFTINGSPDRSVSTELVALKDPPRVTVAGSGTSLTNNTQTVATLLTTIANRGPWTITGATGKLKAPVAGFYQFDGSVEIGLGAGASANSVCDVYALVNGSGTRLARGRAEAVFGSWTLPINFGSALATSDEVQFSIFQNNGASCVVNLIMITGRYVGPS